MNYQKSYNCWIKELGDKPEKAVFIAKPSKPYWVVYDQYMKSICACRDLTSAICIAIRKDGVVRQYGGENHA